MTSSETEVIPKAFDAVVDAAGCLLYFTDEVRWVHANDVLRTLDEERMRHLLEFRLYGSDAEFHATRSVLGEGFYGSLLKDEDFCGESGFFKDDTHRLDIDTTRSSGMQYQSTSGGAYALPVADARTITLRNYYAFDAEGVARFVGFRIVRIDDPKDGEEDA